MDFSKLNMCRLCAKDDVPCKDLMDQNNEEIFKLCRELVHVTVIKGDGLPSQICFTCEEKMVSFSFFIEECKRVQEFLQSKPFVTGPKEIVTDLPVKLEVKNEFAADEEIDIDNEGFSDINTAEFDNDLLDDITIASLKRINAKRKTLNTSNKSVSWNLRALFRMVCEICNEPVRNWAALEAHHLSAHSGLECQPVQHCICGYASYSQSALYKHYNEHKQDDEDSRKQSKIKVRELVQFICKICQSNRRNWTSLENHYKRQHRLPPEVECSCGFVIKSRSMIYKHIQAHNNPREALSCDICPKISKSESALQRHKELKHRAAVKEMNCAMCDRVFTNKELLKSHVRSHIPVEERKCHTCPCCNVKFTTRSAMLSHKKVVHDKLKSYVCDQCGYACGTNGELKQHRAIHSDEKPFVCTKCSKRFKTYSNLKTHMDTHEDTSYACYVCGRVLNSRRTLRKHLLVHQSECRHVCSYCNKAFKRRQTLKVHLSTHTGDKPMSCKWCDEKFAYASTLRSHRLRFHPDKVSAPARSYAAAAAADVAAAAVVAAGYGHTYEPNLKVASAAETVDGTWKVNVI